MTQEPWEIEFEQEVNGIASILRLSNDTMNAVRAFRSEMRPFIKSQIDLAEKRGEERALRLAEEDETVCYSICLI